MGGSHVLARPQGRLELKLLTATQQSQDYQEVMPRGGREVEVIHLTPEKPMAAPPSFRFEQDDFKAIAECLQINFDSEDGDLASHGASFSLDSVTELSLAESSVIILRSGLFSASLTRAYGYLLAARHSKVLFLCGDQSGQSCHLEVSTNNGLVTFTVVSPSPDCLSKWQQLYKAPLQSPVTPAPPESPVSSGLLRMSSTHNETADAWVLELTAAINEDPQLSLETAIQLTESELLEMLRCAEDPLGLRVADFLEHQTPHLAGLTATELDSVVETAGGFMGGLHQLLLLTFPVLSSNDVYEQAAYFAIQQAVLPPLHYIIFPLFVAANAREDAQWHASRIRLGNTSAAALGVADKHLGWVGVEGEHWETVGKLLQEVLVETSALAKLWALKQAVSQLLVCARACKGNGCVLGADDLMPALEYAALTTPGLECFPSNLHFASSLLPESLELGEMGYIVVLGQTIASALIHTARSRTKQSERRITCASPSSDDLERKKKKEVADKLLDRLHKMHDHLTIA